MDETKIDNWSYAPVDGKDRRRAWELLAGTVGVGREHARRMARDLPPESTRHLWGGFDEAGRLAAAAWLMPRAGRTALLFLSPLKRQRHVEPTGRLVAALCDSAAELELSMVQALVDPEHALDQRALLAGGFSHLADLDYLQRLKPRDATPPDWPTDVTLQTYHDSRRPRFAQAMAASYEATLDCPALCGVRRTEDILAGHMAAGQFKPDLWTLLECDGQPAGVLLLNPVPDAQCLELVYIGLSVAARGRGLGRRLMEHALWQAAEQPQPVIAVAVDRANVPATRLYRDFSFYRVATRVAMIRRCPSVDPA